MFDAIFFYFIWKSHNDFLKILVTKIVSHWIYPKGMYMAVIHSCHFLNIYLAISCLHTFRFGFLCVMNIPLFVFSASNSKSSFKVKLKVTSYPKLSQNLLGNSFFFWFSWYFVNTLTTVLNRIMFLLIPSKVVNFLKTEFMAFIYGYYHLAIFFHIVGKYS